MIVKFKLLFSMTAGAVAAAVAAPVQAQADSPPPYPASAYSVFLPYINAPEPKARARTPRLVMSFGGRPVRVTMDTGSTGIVVSADAIPGERGLPGRPGKVTYTSSGRVMHGRWVRTPVFIRGAGESALAVRPIEVLAVTRMTCLAHARNCTPERRPAGVAMMGVGFGREYNLQPEGTPDKNPFLNAAWPPDAAHQVVRGYVVTRDGVHVGLTQQSTQGSVQYAKLDPDPAIPGEWQGVPACIKVDERSPAACGRGLIDTGVTGMFVTLPPALVDHRDTLPRGSRLTIDFPRSSSAGRVADTSPVSSTQRDGPPRAAVANAPVEPSPANPAARYTINAWDTISPMTPSGIVINITRPTPFVNTGVRFLEGYDVLYDADRGFVGFRPR